MSFDIIVPGDILPSFGSQPHHGRPEFTFIIGMTEIVDNKSFYGIHITDNSTWWLLTLLESNGTLWINHFSETWLRYYKQYHLFFYVSST